MLVALTGGIASGKSSVKAILEEYLIPVIDLDEIAHASSEDPIIIEQVQDSLGFHLKNERKELGAYILKHPSAKKQLEAILHPYIYQKMEEAIRNLNDAIIVVDVPLLFETNKQDRFDKVVVVYVDEEEQLNRLMKRNAISKEEALTWIRSQMSLNTKRMMADVVIDNNGSIEALREHVRLLIQQWKEEVHANN